jgi:hypothetical protein
VFGTPAAVFEPVGFRGLQLLRSCRKVLTDEEVPR